ncbi:serine/threonine protein phosphatase [Williamsia sp. 1138]|uniref:PP2C family protein-serine/threonine phosphatase n=1 Tax=Williamsia sp. 1138 TaxID=1903117 RepID=UPI000A1002B1|nr:protein phosphatase 2C domain-containing protein [Williamsia sp. 1138]OZG27559.1 serine/threonine protein phosphatase [Williamsia sp. 1138]
MTLVLRYIARSDRGLVRANNEDSVYAGARLLALADGMGGHAAGEVASQLVIQALRPLDDDEPGGDLLAKLDAATRHGNEAIADQVAEAPELDGMGTTLTAILFAGSRLGLCHIGDSRGYLLRDGQLTQITRDDTFVQTLVEEGRITAEEAHTHPQRSLIMRALTGTEVEPTLTVREARAGDRYLLCSDGLSDVVSEETISDTMSSVANHKDCADRLIELALRGGGPDNVTVVVADVVDVDYGDSKPILGGAAGGDDQEYVPDPRTSAGRAAALRPPAQSPRRPTINTPEPEPPQAHPRRKWIIGGVALAIIVILVAGVFVGRAIVRSNYYVSSSNGEVVLYRGMQGSFLGLDLQELSKITCTHGMDTDQSTVDLVDVDNRPADCVPLKVSDLTGTAPASLEGRDPVPLDDAEAQVRTLMNNLLPLCPEEDSASAQGVTPAPASPAPATPPPGSPAPPAPSGQPAPPESGTASTQPPLTSTTTPPVTQPANCRGR